jgi:TonB family protein
MDYPKYAASVRVEGEVQIACVIKSDGSVESAVAISPKPHPLLVKDAQQNALKWVFTKPAGAPANTKIFLLNYSFKFMSKKPADRPRLEISEDISEFVFEYPNHVMVTFWAGKFRGLHTQ